MNKPKCTEYDYINFLVAAQRVFSTLEAARTQPYGEQGASA
jgi:putative transposase